MPPPHLPNRFFQFFSGMGRAFLQVKFLAVGSSLGDLSTKSFLIGPTVLAPNLEKRRLLGGGGGSGNHPNGHFSPIFLTMKMTFNLNKF